MIEWLRDKFSSVVGVFFVLTVTAITIAGGFLGYSAAEGLGCVIGLALGLFLGIFAGILTFGFVATLIHISDTNDVIVRKLEDIRGLIYNSQSGTSTSNSSSSSYTSSVSSTVSSGYKICKKCGARNSVNSTTCKDCGDYL